MQSEDVVVGALGSRRDERDFEGFVKVLGETIEEADNKIRQSHAWD